MSNGLGVHAEALAAELLGNRGYDVRNLNERRANYPTYDLEVTGRATTFRVSVKARSTEWQINVGKERAVERLSNDSFVMAFLPSEHRQPISLRDHRYRLLIVPGNVARDEGLHQHRVYLSTPKRDGTPRSPSAGVIVKWNGVTEVNRATFRRWLADYEEAWHVLPAPRDGSSEEDWATSERLEWAPHDGT
jgi:hypothetical protein